MRKIQYCCQSCGKIFFGNTDSRLCPDCVKASRANVVRQRICIDCGCTFDGGPRAKRCQECRKIAIKEGNQRYKKNSTHRKLGSLDICEVCGKHYTVTSGQQKYCSKDCQHEALLRWQRECKPEYNKRPENAKARQERREERKKICAYCLRPFWSNKASDLCSDYCREQQRKLRQCENDIKRGYKRDLQKYLGARQSYRDNIGDV